ncbi:MAG: Uma2 family endonuclease [Phormidesmis sp.]
MVSQSATTSIRWTTQDIELLPQNEWTTYEIIDGELFVSRLPHRRHQQIALEICSALNTWSKQSGLGEVIIAPGIILSDADNVIPDAVWVTKTRMTLIEDEAGHLNGIPELVIEVLSSGRENIRRDREAKLKLYSAQGAQEYWIADRFLKQLEVYRRENAKLVLVATLTTSDSVSSPLLPEFSGRVSQFFG